MAFLIRGRYGHRTSILVTLFMWLCFQICILIRDIVYLTETPFIEYYVEIVLDIFKRICGSLLFYVYYSLLNGFLNSLTDTGKPYASVAIINWALLAIVSILSLATCSVHIAYEVQYITEVGQLGLTCHYLKLSSASDIKPIISLIASSVSWMAFNLMFAIEDICYSIETISNRPGYIWALQPVCSFVFLLGIFLGILLCSKWRMVDDPPAIPPVTVYYSDGPLTYRTYHLGINAQQTVSNKRCDMCSTTVTTPFCGKCGAKQAHPRQAVSDKLCDKCGTTVTTAFCGQCGAKELETVEAEVHVSGRAPQQQDESIEEMHGQAKGA
ncbi:uncharacterized protein N7496_003369 [Penicillium cataractarum]|uniref:DZANK-type domain-containing protein n=1 Tax=Penicillium cataractarum TaxID=2100454 RepID=A0A9W9SLU9_9EURO|nr:uncharacterized protein N7496_003369 [Penicillium cataractarum]KAJ5380941.1 hypothetical protein N7496_003369 [Penicillium cataractarum]